MDYRDSESTSFPFRSYDNSSDLLLVDRMTDQLSFRELFTTDTDNKTPGTRPLSSGLSNCPVVSTTINHRLGRTRNKSGDWVRTEKVCKMSWGKCV